VLTRGYLRAEVGSPLVLVGPELSSTADEAGDEPLELARRLPGVPVVVDAVRSRGGLEALRLGADVLVLDDGFQHLPLHRDLDLVLVDGGDPWGGGHLPPLGRLREPPSALRRADAVLVTKVPDDGAQAVDAIRRRVERLAPGLPLLEARLEVRRVRTPDGILPASALAGRRVMPFAGVGRPAAFAELLARCGAEVREPRWFPDHHRYPAGALDEVLEAARRLDATAVTTGKDAVKLPADAPLWVVEVEMAPRSGSWDELWALCPGVLG
jgi:tetraacyldisaccharide 4'-kinase